MLTSASFNIFRKDDLLKKHIHERGQTVIPREHFDEHDGSADVVVVGCADLGRQWSEWRKAASFHGPLPLPAAHSPRPHRSHLRTSSRSWSRRGLVRHA
jgi:hypothetical protein